jgi:hypothetical protein
VGDVQSCSGTVTKLLLVLWNLRNFDLLHLIDGLRVALMAVGTVWAVRAWHVGSAVVTLAAAALFLGGVLTGLVWFSLAVFVCASSTAGHAGTESSNSRNGKDD